MPNPENLTPQPDELLDVFRPERDGNDDPLARRFRELITNDPAAAAKHKESRQFDAAVCEALQQTPVPDGLEDRLLERLNTAKKLSNGARSRSPRWSRRRMLAFLGAGAAAAAGVGIVAWLFRPRRPRPTISEIAAMAQENWNAEGALFGTGKILNTATPAEFAFPHELRREASITWRSTRLGGFRAVAFDIQLRTQEVATLYAARIPVDRCPAFPPRMPQVRGSRTSVAVWREGATVYALVVKGDPRTYRRFLAPAEPIA
ncbi:MAG: hypothetical protein D6741_15010 [Planctomycetota bacterium]|nr:MAG: hypothetical protein D6741_15010 [Planctomycetota bacterium]